MEVEDFSQDLTVKLNIFQKTFDEEEVQYATVFGVAVVVMAPYRRGRGVRTYGIAARIVALLTVLYPISFFHAILFELQYDLVVLSSHYKPFLSLCSVPPSVRTTRWCFCFTAVQQAVVIS